MSERSDVREQMRTLDRRVARLEDETFGCLTQISIPLAFLVVVVLVSFAMSDIYTRLVALEKAAQTETEQP